MDYGHVFRRVFHLCAPVFLIYYIMPDEIYAIDKEFVLLIVFSAVMVVEAVRLGTGCVFFGLRKYERRQLSAFAWGAIAIAIALLFFPPLFVICTLIGMAWTDPLIGELKRYWKKAYPVLPLLVYFIIIAGCLFLLSDMPFFVMIFLACITTFIALQAEALKIKCVDDDFLMFIIPLIILTGLYECFAFTGLL